MGDDHSADNVELDYCSHCGGVADEKYEGPDNFRCEVCTTCGRCVRRTDDSDEELCDDCSSDGALQRFHEKQLVMRIFRGVVTVDFGSPDLGNQPW